MAQHDSPARPAHRLRVDGCRCRVGGAMSREWKPGDVAKTALHGGTVMRAGGGHWILYDGHPVNLDYEPRPLLVIDPEAIPDVPELVIADLLIAAANIVRDYEHGRETREEKLLIWLADRFDELDLTPKPEEPMGLGAVVEDATGERWIRAARINHGWHRPMGTWAAYEDIPAVRVLSEGVTTDV